MKTSRTFRTLFTAPLACIMLALGLSTSARISASAPTSVDLFTYVRVGRFSLPEPTRTTPPSGSLLAQEASSVTYNWDTDTLFITGDGGTSVVQVSKSGVLIDSMTLASGSSPQGTEFYDTEGITYVGSGQFVLNEERYRQANLFTYVGGGTLHRADVKTVKLGTTIGNIGLEGVSYDPQTGGFIFVKEKDPQSIFQTGIDFNLGTATNGSASATSSTNLFNPGLANLSDFSDVFALSNLPFLSGQPDSSHLLVLSQESGQIINVDRAGNVSSRLTITADPGSPLSVPDMTMEGLTMDRDGLLYIVNENGGGDANHPELWVYAHSDAPNLVPTAISFNNAVTSIPENTSTASPVKIADIVVADDGLGDNRLTVTGVDAASFQVIGTGLFLRAGTTLNATTKASYSITVNVDDLSVGLSPDATTDFVLQVTVSTGGTPSLIISEVAPWSSGNSTLGQDWFELTNVGTAPQTITGWKVDDDSHAFGSAISLLDITSIAPGESVIFIETTSSNLALTSGKKSQFLSLWFGATPPANLQVGRYSGSGIGLGTGGDAVYLYDSTGTQKTGVTFGTSTTTSPLKTFDNAAGVSNAAISTLSASGINGAFSITDGAATAIGSPGTIGAPATPTVSISATAPDASETCGIPGTFRIARTGSTAGALAVNYAIATGPGRADGADYTPTLTGVATILSGQSYVDITITPVDDDQFEGPETLTLSLFDTGSYDVEGSSTATVTIADNDPPDTSIDSRPVNPSATSSASFTFSGSEPVSSIAGFECSLDDATFGACTSPAAFSSLSDGSHTFEVRAVGATGGADLTPASFTWTVDTTRPTINGTPDDITVLADAINGSTAVVTFTLPTATDAIDGARPVSCLPASGSTFNLGTVTVTCTASDAAANTAQTTFKVTVDPNLPGRAKGEGRIKSGTSTVQFDFDVDKVVRERRNHDDDMLRIKLDIDGERGKKDRFASTSVQFMEFTNDPSFVPGRGQTSRVDTVVFTGQGKVNGKAGYTYRVTATDRGEPGAGRDTFSIVIYDSGGATVFSATDTLRAGNIEMFSLRGGRGNR